MHDDSILRAVGKPLAAIAAWLGAWTWGDLEVAVRVVGGVIVAGYAATQWWVLWRDKIRRR